MSIRICFRTACVLVMLVVMGCEDLNESKTLRIAVNPWPGYGYFAVVEEREYTSVLEIVETASLSDSVRAFNRGQVDMLGGTLAELAAINHSGKRTASAVLVLNRSVGADMIVASNEITSLEQLAGKRLALEKGSANVLVLAMALAKSGLQLDQIDLLPVPQGEMPVAMTTGLADAAITYPPTSVELESLVGFSRLFDTSQAPNAVIDLLIVADEVIDQHPKELASVIKAHNDALRWGQNNPSEVNEVLAKHTGLSVKEIVEFSDSIEMLELDNQVGFWDPEGPLHSLVPVASRIILRSNNHDAEEALMSSNVLNDRFIPLAEFP